MVPTITETYQNIREAITARPTQNGLYWRPTTKFNQETVNGPLGSLYRNQYGTNIQQYPRDLNTSGKLHSVRFSARPIVSVLDEGIKTPMQGLGNRLAETIKSIPASDTVNTGVAAVKDVLNGNLAEAANKGKTVLGDVITGGNNLIEAGSKLAKPKFAPKSSPSDIIDLYMPDGIEFSQQSQYNQIGLLEAVASIPFLGTIPSLALSGLKNDFARVALNSMGYAFNPQEQVMFEGIEFRTFQMSFTLTPYSVDEATAIQNIITILRKNAAPTIQTGGIEGFFYKPPSIFDVQFLYDGNENTKINKIKPCFLTDVTVNYASNGTWSTYNDGTPVQTTLSLSFKESVLVDSAAIDSGY